MLLQGHEQHSWQHRGQERDFSRQPFPPEELLGHLQLDTLPGLETCLSLWAPVQRYLKVTPTSEVNVNAAAQLLEQRCKCQHTGPVDRFQYRPQGGDCGSRSALVSRKISNKEQRVQNVSVLLAHDTTLVTTMQ